MKSYKKILCLALVAGTLSLFVAACTKTDTPAAQSNTVSNTAYSAPASASVPTRYENVKGVALFSISGELKEKLALLNEKTPIGSDRFFVLLNPKVPTEGILVRSPNALNLDPEGLSNHQIAITGNVITIDSTESGLPECFVEKYGFSLACDGQKRAIYIDAESIDDPDSKPAASSEAKPAAPADPNGEAANNESEPQTVELISPDNPLTSDSVSSEAIVEKLPNPTDIAAPEQKPADSETAASQASQPEKLPQAGSAKSHSLNVTPMAPKASAPAKQAPAEQAAPPAPEAPAETAANTDAAQDSALSQTQDIAPTAQPLSAPPIPQDIAPTSQPLE